MKAYVTLLSTPNYLDGVLVLALSLKEAGCHYPLYCMLSPDIDSKVEDTLQSLGIRCRRLVSPAVMELPDSSGYDFPHWSHTFDKLLVWGLMEFEKVVFIDSDMLVLRNLDHLFDCDAFSAVSAGRSYPGNGHWSTLNSGLMVLVPDKDVEAGLIMMARKVIERAKASDSSVGDQDVIHEYIPGWPQRHDLHLDEGYNVFADFLTWYVRHLGYSPDNGSGKPIYVIHFIGKLKPWMRPGLKEFAWLLLMCIRNPYYFRAYRSYRKRLRSIRQA